MAKKKIDYTLLVFGIFATLWVILVVLLSGSIEESEEELVRLETLENEKNAEKARLDLEVRHLRDYTNKMLNDGEFIADEARGRLGLAEEGEVVVRPEGR